MKPERKQKKNRQRHDKKNGKKRSKQREREREREIQIQELGYLRLSQYIKMQQTIRKGTKDSNFKMPITQMDLEREKEERYQN